MYRACIKSGNGQFKGTLKAEEIEVVWICDKKSGESGDKENAGVENRRKMKESRCIDVVEKKMRKSGVVR